jgi:hypothetical protein
MRAVTRAAAPLSSARNWVTHPLAPPASAGNLQAAGRVAGDLRSGGWRVVILLLMQRVCSKTIGFPDRGMRRMFLFRSQSRLRQEGRRAG